MNRWIPAALAVLVPLSLAALLPGPVLGEEPIPEPPAAPPPKETGAAEAVAQIMESLRANEGAIRVGMATAKADRATPGAAKYIDQRYLPLEGSWLDPEGRLRGTVDWDVDLDSGETVDSICVVLLAGPYDRKAMRKAVVAAGKKIGLAMEPDDEDPDTWYDYRAKGIEIWVTLGDGIVVIEGEVLE